MSDTANATAEAAVTRNHRKTRVGNVVSDVQNKTIIVEIIRRTAHPRYQKVIKHRVKYAVHDEKNEAKVGDQVMIAETRPLSKNKRWRLVKIISTKA